MSIPLTHLPSRRACCISLFTFYYATNAGKFISIQSVSLCHPFPAPKPGQNRVIVMIMRFFFFILLAIIFYIFSNRQIIPRHHQKKEAD